MTANRVFLLGAGASKSWALPLTNELFPLALTGVAKRQRRQLIRNFIQYQYPHFRPRWKNYRSRKNAGQGGRHQTVAGRVYQPLGTLNLPFDDALELARMFCAAEPAAVLAGVETTERDWARKARYEGEEYLVPLLNEYRASWALIRHWTGHDPAIAQREAEIERLERLVWDAVYALQKAGLDKPAATLRLALEKQ